MSFFRLSDTPYQYTDDEVHSLVLQTASSLCDHLDHLHTEEDIEGEMTQETLGNHADTGPVVVFCFLVEHKMEHSCLPLERVQSGHQTS